MPQPGQTAVVIPVPELDPLVDAVAARWPDAVRTGIPAHLTVLYPFVPADRLTDADLARCRELCRGTGPFRVAFRGAAVGPSIVMAPPEPTDGASALTRAFTTAWPGHPPYGGRFGPAPEPHVTLALGSDRERNAAIAAFAGDLLPVHADLRTAVVVELGAGGWTQRAELPL